MPETWDYTLYIPNDLRAVTVARRTLRLILTLYDLTGLLEVAELLATELVSNAVRHTKGPAALRVCRSPEGMVWIGAWDTDPVPPDPPRALEQVAELEAGRGLGLIMACAEYWGWQPAARFGYRGKFTWCELMAA
ncbi:ATP-binding protein [Streptomyces sp. NPDC046942]|uniref:ATP-binding protein n=1 Tax=Streptomyces sp. NPDC046942 TaxID=3155137 RepID=UPI0033C48236